ncbi:MAG TPA: hypothetical protein VHD36_10470 [Pirellulales bacterium]|nr:hypothetical protein [Pirellulales bacterium]
MRTWLLAFTLINLAASELLAQTPLPPSASAGAATDGPLLAPPVIDVPAAPRAAVSPPAVNVPSTAGAPLAPPSIDVPNAFGAPLPPPAGSEAKSKPRFFRLPQPTTPPRFAGAPTAPNQQGKGLGSRFKQRNAPPLTDAPLAGSSAALSSQPEVSGIDAPPSKRANNPRKYGPLELFPKTKESDRTGNPFSLRRPVLAW